MYDAKKIPLAAATAAAKQTEKGTGARGACGDGTVSLDLTGKKPGRGAYVCPSAACLAKARKAGRIARALEVSIPEEIYDAMAAEIEKAGAQKGETHAG
ncbi:MAG: YlxR family protein [Ruthenibacterium lactatiformans]